MYFPPVPQAIDKNGNQIIKDGPDNTVIVPWWHWEEIMIYMAKTEQAIAELQEMSK